MEDKTTSLSHCPIARAIDQVGEAWSILILRDALNGLRRFDEFEKNLGIAPNMLTKRLASLVEAGMLGRRQYSQRPPRYEYVLTDKGRDFQPVIMAMLTWGNRHLAPEGAAVLAADLQSGEILDPVVVDRKTGRIITHETTTTVPGPAANERIIARLAKNNALRNPQGETK
jgi:DNA-binding HxlR family transcriptional regulator